jgi:hypothetical protein
LSSIDLELLDRFKVAESPPSIKGLTFPVRNEENLITRKVNVGTVYSLIASRAIEIG